jgi:rod shape-determining protein MreC
VALLITDSTHALPVQVLRNGVRSIAEGTSDYNRMTLRFVSPTADIVEGDQLVSSGLGGRFPVGYPVGTVASIAQKPGATFVDVEIDPSAELDRSRHLLLVFTTGSDRTRGLK